jgi:phospholipase C
MPTKLSKIEHIVVLMLENRSFDHLLGHLKASNPKVNGVDGSETNHWRPGDPASGSVAVTFDADPRDQLDSDPGHDLDEVREQLYGSVGASFPVPSANTGFLANYRAKLGGKPTDPKKRARAKEIMKCFSDKNLPVLSKLARSFAVCDAWHCSVPGPTWPNRFFAHAATADGRTGNEFPRKDLRTIYHHLEEAGVSWGIYFHDMPHALALRSLWHKKFLDHFHWFGRFLKDVEAGSLPAYSFIEPRYFTFLRSKANDQHPPHDLDKGEELIAAVYKTLRQSPLWNRCLLIVTYDEHGGIYDHASAVSVTPPEPAAPGAKFDFATSGVRVPTVLASPYIAADKVDSTSYDHSSIPATLKQRFNLPSFLTARDANARPLGDDLFLDDPRLDTPTDLEDPQRHLVAAFAASERAAPSPAAARAAVAAGELSEEPLSEFQNSLVELARELEIPGEGPRLQAMAAARVVRTEHDGSVFVQERAQRFLNLPDEE